MFPTDSRSVEHRNSPAPTTYQMDKPNQLTRKQDSVLMVRLEQNEGPYSLDIVATFTGAAIVVGDQTEVMAILGTAQLPFSRVNRAVFHLSGLNSNYLSLVSLVSRNVLRTWNVQSINGALEIVSNYEDESILRSSEVCASFRVSEAQEKNIIIERLTKDRLELVRSWRNNRETTKYMFYQEMITAEAQQSWFRQIDNDSNYYFVIVVEKKPLGIINLKNVDMEEKTGESGIFLAPGENHPPFLGYGAYMTLIDFSVFALGIQKIVATIRSDNRDAVQFNKVFGFKQIEENKEQISMVLEAANYLQTSSPIRRMIGFRG